MSTLTREQVLAMGAGEAMDALVYRRIFGRPLLDAPGGAIGKRSWVKDGDGRTGPLPRYSADIAAAWEVVEEMTRQGRFVEVGSVRGGWYCDVVMGTPWPIAAPTPSLAICRAALLTMLREEE